MNGSYENDGEAALFQREMHNDNLRRLIRHEPFDTQTDSETLRALVKQHNGALEILREILEAHPEDTALMRRARRFMKSVR